MASKYFKKGIIFVFLVHGLGFSYGQDMHQYITKEAFKLLQKSFPGKLNEMANKIGTTETKSTATSDLTWGAGRIVSGAWIEDEYDVVYHYGIGSYPELSSTFTDNILHAYVDVFQGDPRKAFTFISHFWDADLGRQAPTVLSDSKPSAWSFSVPCNAYKKSISYINGDYVFRRLYSTPIQSDCFNAKDIVRSDWKTLSLLGFYQFTKSSGASGYMNSISYTNATGVHSSTACYEGYDIARAYEILGRMCHLLQDMAVPEHVHNEEHADQAGMRSSYYEKNCSQYHQWTADELFGNKLVATGTDNDLGGRGLTYISPFFNNEIDADPVYNLMYMMNQIADHYASASVNGDDAFSAGFPFLKDILPTLGLPRIASEINDANCRSMHDVLQPYAIRLTAGLLYWFAVKTKSFTNQLSFQPFPWNSTVSNARLQTGDNIVYNAPGQLDLSNTEDIVLTDAGETVSKGFIVESGANAVACAGNLIVIKPGFRALPGSSFNAYIDLDLSKITTPMSLPKLFTSSEDMVMDKNAAQLITCFNMSQNAPNPFNPCCKISYQIPNSNSAYLNYPISLRVMNSSGKLIKTLKNSYETTGYYSVDWNGTDDSGQIVSAGIYFCQLVSGRYIKTIRMVFAK